jgi:hypothetical protein
LPEADLPDFSAAMYLDKTLARRAEAEVTLISRKKLCSVRSKCCLVSPRSRNSRSTQMNANLIK